jgi:hypothetical protein
VEDDNDNRASSRKKTKGGDEGEGQQAVRRWPRSAKPQQAKALLQHSHHARRHVHTHGRVGGLSPASSATVRDRRMLNAVVGDGAGGGAPGEEGRISPSSIPVSTGILYIHSKPEAVAAEKRPQAGKQKQGKQVSRSSERVGGEG